MTTDVLKEPVLVLNQNWSPIAMTIARDAVSDLVGGTIAAICPRTYDAFSWEQWMLLDPAEGELVIRSQRLTIRVPEIIVLLTYGKIPQRSLNYSKEHIFKRDRFTCMYCGIQLGRRGGVLTIDHVLPRSQGGVTSWENCVTCCSDCNGQKANRTPQQAGMKLLHFPSRPKWTMDQAIKRTAQERKPTWQKFVAV